MCVCEVCSSGWDGGGREGGEVRVTYTSVVDVVGWSRDTASSTLDCGCLLGIHFFWLVGWLVDWLKCIGLCYVVCLLCERDVVEVNGIDLFIGWQW